MSFQAHKKLLAGSAAIAAALSLGLAAPSQASTTGCHKVAAPGGNDSALGTVAQPIRTAQRLVDMLEPGQVGCFRNGTYSSDEIGIDTPGVTLTSYGSERGTLRGRLWADADGISVTDLNLVGENAADLPSPTVTANGVIFARNDITNNHTAICFVIGSLSHGHATGTLIEDNKIHNCGILPAANHDHGIYVEQATDTVIRGNWIYDNADRGIQLYPNADRTTITANVIDGNGQGIIFGGDSSSTSDGNVVERNVISNPAVRHNVESHYDSGDPVGSGNVVRQNCMFGPGGWYGGPDGSGIQSPQEGFRASENLVEEPAYVNRGAKDFNLAPGSACAKIVDGSLTVGIELRAARSKVRANQALPVSGETSGADSGSEVTLSVQRKGKWVQIGRATVRPDGSFAGKVKVKAGRVKVARLRASARVVGDSNPVKVKVKSKIKR